MKRAGALLLGLLILSFLAVRPVKGAQVLYLSFDTLRMYSQDVDATGSVQVTFSLPEQTCFSGLGIVVTNYLSGVGDSSASVNGIPLTLTLTKSSLAGSVMFGTTTQNICSSTFTVNVGAKSGTTLFHVVKLILFTNATPARIVSSLNQTTPYIPPGAKGTAKGFVINRTSILIGEHNLSKGTISLWIKWNGREANILLEGTTPVIKIDQNGYLSVNASGVYSFPTPLPIGQYIPISIGFETGTGYIMVNSTKVTLNWAGNVVFDRVGDYKTEGGTIIDELKVWDIYIPPDQVIYESQKEGYVLLWRGKAITITPEGGTDLGTLDVVFLNENITTINSTTLSPGSKLAVVPNETALVVISRSGVSRRYWLRNYTEIAFPAENIQLVSSTISIRPTIWQYLTLKTPDGRVATRVKLDSTQTASVMAVLGSDYILSLENCNTTKSMLYTITGDISLWVENDTAKYQGKYFTAQLDDNNKLLIVTYYDQSAETKELHISIRAYDVNNNLKYEIKDIAVEGPVSYYRLALQVSNDTDVMLYKVTIDANGHIYERTVFGEAGGGSVLPSNIVPSGLVIFGAGVVGALMFIAINAYLMPFGALIALSAVKFLGWANVSPSVLGMLGVFSALAMLMYRRDQGVG